MTQYFIEKKIFRNRYLLSQPELVYTCKISDQDRNYPRILHSHCDFLEILFVFKGKGKYFIDDKFYDVKQGDLIILNSGIAHDENITGYETVSTLFCAVKNVRVDNLEINHLIKKGENPIINTGKYYNEILQLYETIFSTVYEKLNGYEIISTQLAYALLSYILYRIIPTENNKCDFKINLIADKAKEYIDNNYMDDISLKKIADSVDISIYHLAHSFKDKYGYSPIQYLLRKRLGEAQTLLLNTNKNITEISTEVGYSNISNFNLIFREKVGISPSQYRNRFLRKVY